MIENLNGIHETVKYKENSNVKLFINVEVEDYPIHWHTPMEIIMPLEGSYPPYIPYHHRLHDKNVHHHSHRISC